MGQAGEGKWNREGSPGQRHKQVLEIGFPGLLGLSVVHGTGGEPKDFVLFLPKTSHTPACK